jgi:pyridoxal phosphate enzyme (YggS family)
MSIEQDLIAITSTLPDHVTLVAVSKTKTPSEIMEAYDAGQRVFGENKVQEMVDKYKQLPRDISWHMIGHVQRNKVKYMASFVDLIHGVDSFKLLNEIDKQAQRHDRIIDCLFQIKIATEASKFGMTPDEAVRILNSEEFRNLNHIKIKGVMGMSTFTLDKEVVRQEFHVLMKTFNRLNEMDITDDEFNIISMGMSGDYLLAIECGSTMVRVGSSIFGERNY